MTKDELKEMKLFQLKRLASQLDIPGRSTMSKAQLVNALAAKRIERGKVVQTKGTVRRKKAVTKARAAATAKRAAVKSAPAKPKAAPAPSRIVAKSAAAPRPSAAVKPAAPPAAFVEPEDVPRTYNVNRLVLMPRDPSWLFAYWEITRERYEWGVRQLKNAQDARIVLRIHDVTEIIDPETDWFPLEKSTNIKTVELTPMADEWYVEVERPNRLYCAEIVLMATDGQVVSLLLSNSVATPSNRVSDETEEEWVTFGRRVSRGRGPAVTKWLREQAQRAVASSPRGWSPGTRF